MSILMGSFSKMVDMRVLVGIIIGLLVALFFLRNARSSDGFESGSGSSSSSSSSDTIAPVVDITSGELASEATNWACFEFSSSGSSDSTPHTLLARIGNDGYVECYNKDGNAGLEGCTQFATKDACTAELETLASLNQKELLSKYVKKYNYNVAGYGDSKSWLYKVCNSAQNSAKCVKVVKPLDPSLVPMDKCGSYVPASTPAPAAPAPPVLSPSRKFGATFGVKPELPTPAPTLNVNSIIATVKTLASNISGISTDSVQIKKDFIDQYGPVKRIPADDNNTITLIYTNYSIFYHNFYSMLDDKNQRIFRQSPFDVQAELINLINQFNAPTMIFLLTTIDPNFEVQMEGEDSGGGGGGGADVDVTDAYNFLKPKILKDIRDAIQTDTLGADSLNIYNMLNDNRKFIPNPPGPNGGSNPPPGPSGGSGSNPPPSNGGSGSDIPLPSGGSGSSPTASEIKPPPPGTILRGPTASASLSLKDIFGPVGGRAADGEECTPTPEPVCQEPPTSCPVCTGNGCDMCGGSGSPSLGQGAGWYNMLPLNNKPAWNDTTMFWGK